MKLYKILGDNGAPCNGGRGSWHLPRAKQPGKWMPTVRNVVPCQRGYHLVASQNIPLWLNYRAAFLYEAEWRGERVVESDKIVVGESRLVSLVGALSDKVLRLFACSCAARTLPIFEKSHPNDARPRKAIATARRFAMGDGTQEELVAARDAARDAVGDAAVAATRAAGDAVWAAAVAATRAARAAAGAAGAARVAAGDAERKWQGQTLLRILKNAEAT